MGVPADPAGVTEMWSFSGGERPPFAVTPGPGQESVWDYPRPPCIVPDARRVLVHAGELLLADTVRALRVLETASPPTFYLPPEDVEMERLEPLAQRTHCEWKGAARYFAVSGAGEAVAWCYPAPTAGFSDIAGHVAFYPGQVCCSVDGETVRSQPGGFYGGWITDEIVGPWKGEPGTGGW